MPSGLECSAKLCLKSFVKRVRNQERAIISQSTNWVLYIFAQKLGRDA